MDETDSCITWLPVLQDAEKHSALMLHLDGASRGNPGPSGAGAVLSACFDGCWYLAACGYRFLGCATNNFAEASSLALGLEVLEAFLSAVHILE